MKRKSIKGSGSIAFERSYLAALDEHVKTSRGKSASDRIGRRALELGVETLALARIHDRSVSALASPDAAGKKRAVASSARGDSFFARAVTPIEEAHCGTARNLFETRRLTAELATARTRLGNLQIKLDASARHDGQQLERSRLMENRLRRLSHKLLSAQEEERLRISRDLHDAIGQTLTGINVSLATLKREAAAKSQKLADSVTRAQSLVERSMKTVHQFAWELRPTLLDDLGLLPALRSYCSTFSKRTGIRVHFAADSKFARLGADHSTALFRVAQGALSNVERHAQAAHVRLSLRSSPGMVRLEVKDDGRSFDVLRMENSKTNKHLGLLVMRERVEMVGGSFTIASSPGHGTSVCVEVPLEVETRE